MTTNHKHHNTEMKARTFMTFAIAAALLTACNENNEPNENRNGEIRLRSGIEMETRAYTPTQSTAIADGEKVSVWVDDAKTPNATEHLYKANPLTADGSNGLTPDAGSEMYFPQTGNSVNIFALHGNFSPTFIKDDAFPSAGVKYSVKGDQKSAANYTGSDLLYAYSPGVARTKEAVPLKFYHMLSKIEVAIKAGAGAPELSKYDNAVNLNGVTLNGKFTPGTPEDMSVPADRAKMLGDADTPATGSITLNQEISADFTDNNIKYNEAVVIPQSMTGKTLTFKLNDGGILTYPFPNNVTFESGKKYRYQITINLTELSVTSEITDWEAVDAVTGEAVMQ